MTAAPAPPRARPLPGRGVGGLGGGGDGKVLKAIGPRGGPASERGGAQPAAAPVPSLASRRPPARALLRPGPGRRRLPGAPGSPPRGCQLPASPDCPTSLCHGRLGFLGMGFGVCHKSHCQGFPTDPGPYLRGRHCRGFCPPGWGGGEAPRPPALYLA
ncbi:wiskott-Aldrich syndrome protein homolog [Choloepus didactylus]|uniref:wiskott-Aldrich syndrome protein homolog n=1 Tax=Choloepus didactylus TaxID=27675 RepID=UPI00189E63BC|nr:wiskott-Aldrich syndrome protein homolog [Choloepus didactylus]